MTNDPDTGRHEHIQALHAAARLERAQTLQRLLQSLLRPRGTAQTWPAPGRPALGESC